MLRRTKTLNAASSGFTLIEALVVVVLVAILAAIAAPSWLAYLNRQRVGAVRSDLVTSLSNIQQAAQQKRSYQTVWIDVGSSRPQIFYGGDNADDVNSLISQELGPASIPDGAIELKAFRCVDTPCTSTSASWTEVTDVTGPCNTLSKACFQFDYTGGVSDPTRKILPPETAQPPDYSTDPTDEYVGPRVPYKIEISAAQSSTKSCVIVANLLGNVKSGRDDFCDLPPGDWAI